MSFWADRLGVQQQQQQQPAAPAPQPTSTAPWWMPKPVVPQQPQQPATAPTQPVQQGSVAPQDGASFSEMLAQDGYTTDKAQSAKDTEQCPNCGSNNYMRASGQPNSMKQCFECGSNPRFEQMASGITGVQTSGPVRSARVQNVGDPSFKPMGTIFQHI